MEDHINEKNKSYLILKRLNKAWGYFKLKSLLPLYVTLKVL